jgi:hypothetical protein
MFLAIGVVDALAIPGPADGPVSPPSTLLAQREPVA